MPEKHFIPGTRNLYTVDGVAGRWTMTEADNILRAMRGSR